MKTRTCSISVLLLIVLLATGCQPIQAPVAALPTPAAAPTPIPAAGATSEMPVILKVDKIDSEALAGNAYGDPTERTLYVVLPADYDTSDKRYPVLYAMPWRDGEGSGNAAGFQQALKLLRRSKEVQEMIVVVPDGQNAMGIGHFRSSPVLGDYEAYVTQEVVNYVDANYRTLAQRESRGIAGCSSGGYSSMRLGLQNPDVYGAIAATGGIYDESLDLWPGDVEYVRTLTELPSEIGDWEPFWAVNWNIYGAAEAAPDASRPPFYAEMPIRIVDGHGEFVPEVMDKIVAMDAAHAARRYMEQPLRLNGILILQGLFDDPTMRPPAQSFVKQLTELGIDHAYREVNAGHCPDGWEKTFLMYMNDVLVFEE